MNRWPFIAALAALLLPSAVVADDTSAGWVIGDGSTTCMATARHIAPLPAPLRIVIPGHGTDAAQALAGTAVARLRKPCPAMHDNDVPGDLYYAVQLGKELPRDSRTGEPVSHFAGIVDFDGRPLTAFRVCNSMEGFHYTVWDGEPLQGRLLWHRYQWVDYGMESSSCSDADMPAVDPQSSPD